MNSEDSFRYILRSGRLTNLYQFMTSPKLKIKYFDSQQIAHICFKQKQQKYPHNLEIYLSLNNGSDSQELKSQIESLHKFKLELSQTGQIKDIHLAKYFYYKVTRLGLKILYIYMKLTELGNNIGLYIKSFNLSQLKTIKITGDRINNTGIKMLMKLDLPRLSCLIFHRLNMTIDSIKILSKNRQFYRYLILRGFQHFDIVRYLKQLPRMVQISNHYQTYLGIGSDRQGTHIFSLGRIAKIKVDQQSQQCLKMYFAYRTYKYHGFNQLYEFLKIENKIINFIHFCILLQPVFSPFDDEN